MSCQLRFQLVDAVLQRLLMFSRVVVRDNFYLRLSDTYEATISRDFCVRTHWSEKRLQVAHGVSPSHLIFLLLHRSQALLTTALSAFRSTS
jgi:hypothetical protein